MDFFWYNAKTCQVNETETDKNARGRSKHGRHTWNFLSRVSSAISGCYNLQSFDHNFIICNGSPMGRALDY